jgi:hypothetical protein
MAARGGGGLRIGLLAAACIAAAVSYYFFRPSATPTVSDKWQLRSTAIYSGRSRVVSLQTRSLLSGQRFRVLCVGKDLAMSANFGYLHGAPKLKDGTAMTITVPGQSWTSTWVYVGGKFYNSQPDQVVRLLNGLYAGRGFRLDGARGERISLDESPPDKDIRHLARACGYRITAANSDPSADPRWQHPLTVVVNAIKGMH